MTKPRSQSQSTFSQLKDFLAYLATTKGDLSNITAPPFVLSPRSVTEIPASWAERHALFLQPAREADPARRALLVLKNFLCSLKRQVYYTAAECTGEEDAENEGDDGGAKKPLNAFLGELFLGSFEGEGEDGSSGETRLICEQVSHHPPVTACCIYNKAYGISSCGYVAQETTFSATAGVKVKQVGHAIIRDEAHRESHLRTLPTMAVKGLLTGKPYPELEGTCYISSSSGYLATIKFGGSGMLGSGTRNSVHAEISNIRGGNRVLFEVDGQWNGRLTIINSSSGKKLEEFEVDDVPLTTLATKPRDEQSAWESRKAWSNVVQGINTGEMHVVADEKNAIENAQREMRAAEEQASIEWPRLFFHNADTESQEFALLAKAIPDAAARSLDPERTAGVWKFIGVGPAEALLSDGIHRRSLGPAGQSQGVAVV
ncbi:Oxysterol-binding protein [Hypoxylon rubiginosum]|uniref:Oxysterol-binding protein n=1 Tax=Hypoxylon rubiginosum TaxID=110542 RepID=A0ACC0DAP4_9PEZI|nr:Oxysterol-binding protein [Hypoxylon rubiginosum]